MTEPETTNEKPKRKFAKKNITVKPEEVVVGASFPGKVVRHPRISTHVTIATARPYCRKQTASAPSERVPDGTGPTPAFFVETIGERHRRVKPINGGFWW